MKNLKQEKNFCFDIEKTIQTEITETEKTLKCFLK